MYIMKHTIFNILFPITFTSDNKVLSQTHIPYITNFNILQCLFIKTAYLDLAVPWDFHQVDSLHRLAYWSPQIVHKAVRFVHRSMHHTVLLWGLIQTLTQASLFLIVWLKSHHNSETNINNIKIYIWLCPFFIQYVISPYLNRQRLSLTQPQLTVHSFMKVGTNSGSQSLCLLNSSFTYWFPRACSSTGNPLWSLNMALYKILTLEIWVAPTLAILQIRQGELSFNPA